MADQNVPSRLLLVTDGDKCYLRRVKTVVQDDRRKLMVYECDGHLGGPFDSLEEGVAAMREIQAREGVFPPARVLVIMEDPNFYSAISLSGGVGQGESAESALRDLLVVTRAKKDVVQETIGTLDPQILRLWVDAKPKANEDETIRKIREAFDPVPEIRYVHQADEQTVGPLSPRDEKSKKPMTWHQRAMDLSIRAERALLVDRNRLQAIELYREAARLEMMALRTLPKEHARTRRIYAVSVVALHYKAQEYQLAIDIIDKFLVDETISADESTCHMLREFKKTCVEGISQK